MKNKKMKIICITQKNLNFSFLFALFSTQNMSFKSKQLVAVAQRVQSLRHWLSKQSLDAFIVPTADAHQSEYVSEADKRRVFLTGFTGSAGTALVTAQHALLWTDARYFDQAEIQLGIASVTLSAESAAAATAS